MKKLYAEEDTDFSDTINICNLVSSRSDFLTFIYDHAQEKIEIEQIFKGSYLFRETIIERI